MAATTASKQHEHRSQSEYRPGKARRDRSEFWPRQHDISQRIVAPDAIASRRFSFLSCRSLLCTLAYEIVQMIAQLSDIASDMPRRDSPAQQTLAQSVKLLGHGPPPHLRRCGSPGETKPRT